MDNLLCTLLQLYVIALIGRVILSWFPLSPDSPFASIYSFVFTITEPVLGPVRRILPPMGGLDLSPLIVVLGAQILQNAVCR